MDRSADATADPHEEPGPQRGRILLPRGGALAIVLPFFLLTAVLFCYNVGHHFFLGDDCFISFRYARHLAAGQGLVWNPGERVEGYTNFLWVILMAGAPRLGGTPPGVSKFVGVYGGAPPPPGPALFSASRGWARRPLRFAGAPAPRRRPPRA